MKLIGKALAPLWHESGHYERRWRAAAHRSFTLVLCYHRVVDDREGHLFNVEGGLAADVFERQMRFMLRRFRPVKPSQALDPAPAGEMRFAVTFDDGTGDNYSIAAPILERLGLSAGFFVVRDYVGTDRRFWWEQLAGLLRHTRASLLPAAQCLPRGSGLQLPATLEIATLEQKARAQDVLMPACLAMPHAEIAVFLGNVAAALDTPLETENRDFPLMNWNQLRDLAARGFEIGGHTANHVNLGRADAADLDAEVVAATAGLADDLDAPVRIFAYPYGEDQHRSPAAVMAVARTGVTAAFTTSKGIAREDTNRLLIPRVQLNRNQAFVWSHNIDQAVRGVKA